MINFSRLLSGSDVISAVDAIRYSRSAGSGAPVVVWHMTGRCNLSCRHCYSSGGFVPNEGVMSSEDETALLRRLAKLSAPCLLLSGGEPLLHPFFSQRLALAGELGLSVAVSTNGTLIDERTADLISDCASYAGISVDGPGGAHDRFRGVDGAFAQAVQAINLLASRGCRVGLRVTLAAPVIERLYEIFLIAENLPVSRICFYHFMRSGRGHGDPSLVPGADCVNLAARSVIEWAEGYHGEVLTAGDAADSVRLYKYLESRSDPRIAQARKLMRLSAQRPAGCGILSVRWDGEVFRNQFMWGERLGTWDEIERIADTAGASAAVADECASCGWFREICGGRADGFGERCALKD